MKKGLTLFLIVFSSFFLIACTNNEEPYVPADFYAMNTIISVSVPADIQEEENFIKAHEEMKNIFDYLHFLTDNYNQVEDGRVINSIYNINEKLMNSELLYEEFEINFELYEMLAIGEEVENLTNGYFNLSIGHIIDIWKSEVITKTDIVSNEIINDVIEQVNKIEVVRNSYTLSEVNNKYYVKVDTRVKLDLGAVAKGYALEKAIDIFRKYEITSYIISAGSSSIALGEKTTGDGTYTIGLINPEKTWTFYAIASAKNTSATTSGNYEQSAYDEDGNIYHHLISPITKRPESYYGTLTVLSNEHAAKIDALTTGLYLMDVETRDQFLVEHPYETLSYNNNSYDHINPKHEVTSRLEN